MDKAAFNELKALFGEDYFTPCEKKESKVLSFFKKKKKDSGAAEPAAKKYALLEFQRLVEKATTIAYDPDWANGTGYLDGMVNVDLNIEYGEFVTFIDDKNRIGIATPSPFGNLVVFQRYSEGDGGILVGNFPTEFKHLTGRYQTSLSVDEICELAHWAENANDILADFCEGRYKVEFKEVDGSI